MMINCIAQELRIVDPSSREVTHRFPAAEHAAIGRRSEPEQLEPVDGIPVVSTTAFVGIDHLPERGDVVVSLAVVEAMRQLGLEHDGRVFTPQPLVFDEQRKPIGTPGLILHVDVSACA